MFRVNGEPAIGLAIAMRDGGDILALGKNLDKAMAAATANLPVGIHPLLVSDQAVTVKTAISEFMESLWQAVGDHPRGQLHRARRAAGAGRGAGDPADAGDRLLGDGSRPHRHAAHFARRADHRACAPRRRRDDHDRRDAHAAARRRHQARGGVVRLPHLRLLDAGGHAGDDRRIHSGRFRGEFGRRIHLLAVCGGRDGADRLVVRRGPVRAAPRRGDPEAARGAQERRAGLRLPNVPERPDARHSHALADDRPIARAVRRLRPGAAADPAPVLPVFRPAGTAGRSVAAAERLDLCERDGRGQVRRAAQGRPGRRTLEHLHRPRRDPLLPAAQRPAAEQLLLAGGHRRKGRAGAGPAEGQARKSAGERFSGSHRAGLSARARAAGRLAGPVPRERSGRLGGARDRLEARRRPSPRTRTPRTSTSTGWSRRGRSAS